MNFNEAMQMLGTKLQGKYGHLGFKYKKSDKTLTRHSKNFTYMIAFSSFGGNTKDSISIEVCYIINTRPYDPYGYAKPDINTQPLFYSLRDNEIYLDIGNLDDSIILERVMQKLKVLAHSPEHIQLPKAAPVSTDALRIENELALCFNRADINPEYMKTLIMAAAAERYAGLNDPTPTHKLELLRQKLELEPESEETLWEVFESAVAQVRIGKGGEISLHQKDQKECAL